uniref:Uncharacterized protein n=1 Tax=Arundo donax TaxID=35708 RepID=A0A0A9A171_ARUDO
MIYIVADKYEKLQTTKKTQLKAAAHYTKLYYIAITRIQISPDGTSSLH